LEVKHFLSREDKPGNAAQGHINRTAVEDLMNRLDNIPLDFYLCGPELMTSSLIKDIGYLGTPNDRIHTELFLINTSTLMSAINNAKVSAKVFGHDFHFEVKEGSTILKSGLASNVPLPYSCQSGLCGMCKMKCSEGRVLMKNNQVLTDENLKEGYILTCQAVPQTSTVTISNSQ
jgi:ring-1,2-phenylacetyl-CoA epoxidase subunit PaaE